MSLFLLLLALPVQAPADEEKVPLSTVSAVDLSRYPGGWYEIASYPAWFQQGYVPTRLNLIKLPKGAHAP